MSGTLNFDLKRVLSLWWVALTFVLMCGWVSFLWIGFTAKKRSWTIFGCLYFILTFLFPMVAFTLFETDSLEQDVLMWISVFVWIATIFHSFLCIDEYSRRRRVVIANREAEELAYFEENVKKAPSWSTSPQQPAPVAPQAVSEGSIDLNTASEQELASLPGISVALAKKAVAMRQTEEFISVQDFIQRVGVMPHFAVRIEKLACIKEREDPGPPKKGPGRVVDI